jgi:hypothetical protein
MFFVVYSNRSKFWKSSLATFAMLSCLAVAALTLYGGFFNESQNAIFLVGLNDNTLTGSSMLIR